MVRFAGKTDPGQRPGENEDTIGWDDAGQVWFVADGMGGHAAGQVASRAVKTTLLERNGGQPIAATLVEAHRAIRDTAAGDDTMTGMGSTAVVARIVRRSLEVTWVGDSRAYLWRRGELARLSRDHSFVELLRQQNLLSEEEVQNHPKANLVTQTLGHDNPEPSVVRRRLLAGDWILLCSDGLNDELSDSEIGRILRGSSGVDDAVENLVGAALKKGGRDNTSAIVIEFDVARGGDILYLLVHASWFPVVVGSILAAVAAALLWGKR